MAKVHINGEIFDWDGSRRTLGEALALEEALAPWRYDDWREQLRKGSARALAGFIWLVWRRNGRDVALKDILSGAVEVDLSTYDIEDDTPVDPTTPAPEPSATTGGST